MEVGVYHEFHCRPEQTQAAAFAEALAQIEAADRWGLDAIWLAEIHQQARRSVMSAPMTVASAIAARTKRIKIGTGVQVSAVVPSAASGRGNRHGRPDQPGPAAVRRRPQRQPAQLHGLWRALFGKPRTLSRDPGHRQAGVDAGTIFLRRQVLAFRQRQRGAAALPEALPADPRRRRQRGDVSVFGRGRLSDFRRGAQRLAVGSGARSRRLPPGPSGPPVIPARARSICG